MEVLILNVDHFDSGTVSLVTVWYISLLCDLFQNDWWLLAKLSCQRPDVLKTAKRAQGKCQRTVPYRPFEWQQAKSYLFSPETLKIYCIAHVLAFTVKISTVTLFLPFDIKHRYKNYEIWIHYKINKWKIN